MDEIRSSDALEQEIREEARRRADKILKEAARDCEALERQGRERLERELSELSARYALRKQSFADETASRLPLERKRRRILWAEARLRASLDDALASLGKLRLSSILGGRLRSCLESFAGREVRILWKDLDGQALLESIGPDLQRHSCRVAQSGEGAAVPGLLVESLDASVRFQVDLGKLREELLDLRRGELATALLGDLEGL